MSGDAFYIEFVTLGGQVKVTAIDPETACEVSIVAPTTASQSDMSRLAVQKLKLRIARESVKTDEAQNSTYDDRSRAGILV